MKLLYPILFLIHAVSGLRAPSAVTNAAIHIRGGGRGDFPIKKSSMVKIFCGFYALNGALSLPAPESAKDYALKEGTLDYVIFENLGAMSLSYAMLVYYTAFSRKSASRAVALSSLPCAYVSYKNMLKGITGRLTGSKFHGPLRTCIMVICIYQILSGRGDTQLFSKILAAVPLCIGLLSQVDIRSGMKLSGFGSSVAIGRKGQAIYVWYAALMVGWGALSLMNLCTRLSPMRAIGRAALLETFFMIDCIWIRKWNVGVAPNASNYVFLGVPLLTAASIFLS